MDYALITHALINLIINVFGVFVITVICSVMTYRLTKSEELAINFFHSAIIVNLGFVITMTILNVIYG